MASERGVECDGAFPGHRRSGAVVNGGLCPQADSTVAVFVVVPLNRRQCARASSIEPKRCGKSGRYFRVLNCASEYGLSSETCGRLWVLATSRSMSSAATAFDRMLVPRSA